MLRTKIAAASLVVAGVVGLAAGPALADDCVNVSRNTSPAQATSGGKTLETSAFGDVTVKGHWIYLGDVWLFVSPGTVNLMGEDTSGLPGANGNFTNGQGDGLLEQSGTASDGRRCEAFKGHGMIGECGEEH